MKRILFFVLFTGVMANNIYAVLDMSGENVNGPVKQLTEKYFKNNSSTCSGESILWYDEKGRVTEEVWRFGGLVNGIVSQYLLNNVRMDYFYDNDGLVKGSFRRNQLDSMGNCISSQTYREGKIFSADSTVYNERGQKIEYYEYPDKADTLVLQNKYEYDSLGRLIKEYRYRYISPEEYSELSREFNINPEDFRESVETIEYFPNGNYTKHFFSIDIHLNKKKDETKYIVNKKGLVTKIINHIGQTQFIYQNFDKYGNWLKKTKTTTGYPINSTETIERVIEYYE